MNALMTASAALLASFPLAAAAQPQVLWLTQPGTSAFDNARAIANDAAGGLFAAGSTNGSLGGPNQGSTDGWLARYDPAGSQLWIIQLGTSGIDSAAGLAPDGAGGVFVSGPTAGSLGGPNAGGSDAYLARYDDAGDQLWIVQFGTSLFDSALAAAPDGAGGVFICGETAGSLGGPSAGGPDAWLARFDSAGNQLWITQFGTPQTDNASILAHDGAGGVFVAGNTQGSLGAPHSGEVDAFLARYDADGVQLWITQFGTSGFDFPFSLAHDGAAGVFFSGSTQGSLGGPNQGGPDAWLARFDPAGSQLWITQFGTAESDSANALAPDGAGGVFIGGGTGADLGGPHQGGFSDAWLGRYDPTGSQLWIMQLGTEESEFIRAIAADGADGVFIAGETSGSLGGPYQGGFGDAFLGRIADEPSCYPDCDGNGLLNIDDFLCFQLMFALNDPYADCDKNQVFNIDDFLCFQLAFALGC